MYHKHKKSIGIAPVTATAVGGEDIGGNSDGGGHRQQSTIIGSEDTVAVATAMDQHMRVQQ